MLHSQQLTNDIDVIFMTVRLCYTTASLWLTPPRMLSKIWLFGGMVALLVGALMR